jgi:micrococcal nuclease
MVGDLTMWEYRCRVTDVYDADTFWVEIDLGFRIVHRVRVRLLNIDTPEIRGEERVWGLRAKDYLIEWLDRDQEDATHLDHDWPFIVKTAKTGKYGRWLADLRHADGDVWVTDALKEAGFDTEDWKNW